DLEDRQLLTVTEATLVAGLVLVVHAADLRALGGLDDLGVHGDLGKLLGVGGDVGAVDEQNRGESHGGTRLTLDLLDLDEVTFGNLVLLAAGLDDRVHRRGTPFFVYSTRGTKAPRHGQFLLRSVAGLMARRRGFPLAPGMCSIRACPIRL